MENQNNQTVFSSTCQKCGRTLYEGEMLNIKEKYVCEPCANSFIFGTPEPRVRRSVPSPFFNFMFSFMPGAGQMYQGFMKRGLFQMCLFFFSIFLTASVWFTAFTIPVIWFYSFFDSLALRRKIASGEYVSDDLNGVTMFLSRNRRLIIVALIIMLATGAFSSIAGILMFNRASVSGPVAQSTETFVSEAYEQAEGVQHSVTRTVTTYNDRNRGRSVRTIAPALVIGIGGIMILKAAKNKKSAKDDIDDIEIRN